MRTGDTIVAVASAPGRSRRAIVRLSGAHALDAVARLLDRPCDADRRPLSGAPGAPGARIVRVALPSRWATAGGVTRTPALLAAWRAPASYTGEDCVELHLPGNPSLVARVVDALCAYEGVRPADPGEFTSRAFLHGKVTLDEAEGVAAVIAATSESARRAAARALSGEAGARFRAWRDEVADLLALVEAGIDFTDQDDVVPIAPDLLAGRLDALRHAIARAVGPGAARATDAEAPRVALVGPPNAGKSTLFNALLGRRRAVVSDRAGSTRDAIVERLVSREGDAVDLIDLAGLDESLASRSAVDALARRAALDAIADADALVLCDPSGAFERGAWFPAELRDAATPALRVRTKADMPRPLASEDSLPVCAIDGGNLETLRDAIFEVALGAPPGAMSELIPRHRVVASSALAAIAEARGLVQLPARALLDAELVADALRRALDSLGDAAGDITPDEVLGRIFASFCVGK